MCILHMICIATVLLLVKFQSHSRMALLYSCMHTHAADSI